MAQVRPWESGVANVRILMQRNPDKLLRIVATYGYV
jgi:hypothetical protein